MFTEILHVSISKFVHVREVLSYTNESISQLKSSFFILAGVIKNYWLVFKIQTSFSQVDEVTNCYDLSSNIFGANSSLTSWRDLWILRFIGNYIHTPILFLVISKSLRFIRYATRIKTDICVPAWIIFKSSGLFSWRDFFSWGEAFWMYIFSVLFLVD